MSERDEYCEIAGSGRNDALRLGDGLLDTATDTIADLRAEVAEADRNARFVEKVREALRQTAVWMMIDAIEAALCELDSVVEVKGGPSGRSDQHRAH